MINLSAEQKKFLQELSDWAFSDGCKRVVYNRVCSVLQELIKKKEKAGEQLKMNILIEKLIEEKEKFSEGSKYCKTTYIVESIQRSIERCYENNLFGIILMKFVKNIDAAKEHLLSSNIKMMIPSDTSLDMIIENNEKEHKLDGLISILDAWITNPENFTALSNDKINAIRAKYQRYKNEFNDYRQTCSICVLSNYIDKPEEAKDFISEIFTNEQEAFYSKLEKWTESLENKDCGKWLNSFLEKGRNLRISNIKVLRFIDNEYKAKEFLLSKYNEKLNWDKKKKEQRENKYKSVFDNYDDCKNSLNSFVPGLTKDTKLYSICLSSNANDKVEPLTLMSYEDGIEIRKDCIKLGAFVYHLSLRATNQLFYTYSSTYRKHTRTFSFFSPFALSIIKEYCSTFLDKDILDNTKGCVVIREYESVNSKCYCCLLTDKASYFRKEPIFVFSSLASSGKCYYDVAGYRFIFKALIWHLLKDKTKTIDFSADTDFSSENRRIVFNLINRFYDSMSFEDKYICHFIDTDKYKFPTAESNNHDFTKKGLMDRITNLKNCICYQYNSQLFEDRFFQFAKIEYEYGDTNFKKLVDTIGGYISKGKYLDLWFDNTSDDFISNLRVLTFINWVYVSNETGNIKKITACWLLDIIYKQYKNSYEKDKNFWTLVLAYILYENQPVYDTLIRALKNSNQNIEDGVNIASIINALTKNIRQLKKKLTFEQKRFLSDNMYKCTLFEDYQNRNKDANCCKLISAESIIYKICKLIEANQGTIPNYSKQAILELLKEVPKFVIPQNFIYTRHRSYNYRYNGDYQGTYAHDVMGYSNSDIDTIFDGDPDAYWNID